MRTAEEIHERIRFLLKDRLKKLGSIRTINAWQICKDEFPYGTIAYHFKIIMLKMRQEQKVDFIKNGTWFIYKNIK